MYKIEKRKSGYLLTFSGYIGPDEMLKWVDKSKKALENQSPGFGVIVDMRDLIPLLNDAQRIMILGQSFFKQKGMKRSAVILNDPVVCGQFERLAKESGIYEWERYIPASTTPNWEEVAVDWVVNNVDPAEVAVSL